MSSAVWAAQRYCCPRLAKLPVSGSTEPMRTSLTLAAGATRWPIRAPDTTETRARMATRRRRMRGPPTEVGIESVGLEAVRQTEDDVMRVERRAGRRRAPEDLDVPGRRYVREAIFGEGRQVRSDQEGDPDPGVETDVGAGVGALLETDRAAEVGEEDGPAQAHVGLQAPGLELIVLEEAVACHHQQRERHRLHVSRRTEVRHVRGHAEPREVEVLEPSPEAQAEEGRAAAAEALLLFLPEGREGERAAAGHGGAEVGVREPFGRRGRGEDENRQDDRQEDAQASHGRLISHD